MLSIFDSHAHYDDARFDPDRGQVLDFFAAAGVRAVCNIGADLPSSRAALALAHERAWMWAAVGVHPGNAAGLPAGWLDELRALTDDPRAVAVGEIGLDYHYDDGPPPALQQEVFRAQMALAARCGLPVVVHARDAVEDSMAVVRAFPQVCGVFHCFSGTPEQARELVSRGWYLGFTGVITFQKTTRIAEVLRQLPHERILIETDAPYLAPAPHRGERCDSRLLVHTLARLAELLGLSFEQAAALTDENARRLYRLPPP